MQARYGQGTRRGVLAGLMASQMAALALWAVRRGVPGSGRLAGRVLPRPGRAQSYGYKEIHPA